MTDFFNIISVYKNYIIYAVLLIGGSFLQAFILIKKPISRNKIIHLCLVIIIPAVFVGALGFGGRIEEKSRINKFQRNTASLSSSQKTFNVFDKDQHLEKTGKMAIETYALLYVVLFSAMLGLVFRNQILPNLNRLVILIYNTAFFYYILSFLISRHNFYLINYFSVVFLIFIAIIFIVTIFYKKIPLKFQTLLYGWYILLLLFFVAHQYILNYRGQQDVDALISQPAYILSNGMLLMFVVVNIQYLILFVPIRIGLKSDAERVNRVREYFYFLADKFIDFRIKPSASLFLVVVLLFLFLFFDLIHSSLLNTTLSFLIVLAPSITSGYLKKRTALN